MNIQDWSWPQPARRSIHTDHHAAGSNNRRRCSGSRHHPLAAGTSAEKQDDGSLHWSVAFRSMETELRGHACIAIRCSWQWHGRRPRSRASWPARRAACHGVCLCLAGDRSGPGRRPMPVCCSIDSMHACRPLTKHPAASLFCRSGGWKARIRDVETRK